MLKCIQADEEDESSQILTKCTMDASQSDIHVIPMGMAGEMWPYFQPNHGACVDYAEGLDKDYDNIVAFLPTGWADSSNWNKKNAISRKTIKGNNEKEVQCGNSTCCDIPNIRHFQNCVRLSST